LSAFPLAGAAAVGRWLTVTLRIDGGLFRHASVLLVATLLGQALSFLRQVVLARRIGIESYGLYAYAISWVSFLSMLALMGSDRVLVRYLPEYGSSRQHGLFRGVLACMAGTGLAVSVAAGLGFYALRRYLHPPSSAEEAGALAWAATILPLMVIAGVTENALRGCGAHAVATWPSRVLRPVFFILLILAPLGVAQDARWALALNGLAILLAFLPTLRALWARLPPRAGGGGPLPVRIWLTTSVVIGVNSVALYLNSQIDMLVLGFVGDQTALGTYGALTRIVTVVSLASSAVITIVQPMIATARAEGRDLGPLVRGGARMVFLASAGAGLVTFAAAPELLSLFGERFATGATALRILSLGWTTSSLLSLAGPLLLMTGHERNASAIMVQGALLNLVLNLLLTPRFGIDGAATATALSAVAWNVALFLVARARVGVAALPVRLRAGG
jgi:O-antigen/teichoic acid export membrane protein